ncbi:hypothetical protein [Campylobacter blaseri]|uniref:hypothetical protein n=1 Tax=Campylobacter blaseri TaxID=2042961 RepID=UPI001056E589|nr:hypothetical protein [Campylobacter blaseri]
MYSIFWFLLSLITVFYLPSYFQKGKFPILLLFCTAFLGAFFTSYLYFGFISSDALYFALLCGIIAVSFNLGIGIIV